MLAAVGGAAAVLCFAPFGLFWLAPLLWGLFFTLLCRAQSVRESALTGLAFGLGFYLLGVSWVYVSLSVFGGMPWWLAGPAAFLFCLVMALFPMAAATAFHRWPVQGIVPRALWFAALIVAVDWLKSWIFTGFPWLTLGYSQAPPSPLAAYAPLIGVFGLSLLVALSGALLLCWRVGVPVLLALVAGGVALQQVRWTQPEGEAITVSLVQGNIPQEMKFRPEAFYRTIRRYEELIAAHPAQLTLLPETAVPSFFDRLPPEIPAMLKTLAQRAGGDIVFGTVTGDGDRYFNSAVSLGNAPAQVYSKQHLVPFGEFIPPGFAWFMRYANIPMSAFSRGPATQAPLAVGGRNVAVNICYEDVFGHEIARALPAAGILANLSNTAWFGRSLAQPQHLQIAQMRALETGRPMLRATNTGMTAIIGSDGHIEAVLPPFTSDVLQGQVRAYTGLTPYVRWRDWPALGLALACALAAFGLNRRSAAATLSPRVRT